MPAQLDVYNLGQLGINVDKSPIHLDENELVTAQNVVQNKQGVAGGLVNRPSLTKYDTDVAAGSIAGAICAPLGPGPGATTDDTLTYYLGIDASPYWRTSSNSFSTSSTVTTLARMGTNDVRASAMLGRRLYYIARTVADNQSIRVFDGVQDRLFTVLPTGYAAVRMAALKGQLYIAAANSTTAAYVFQVNALGQLRQVGAALPTAIVEFNALGYHNSDLYVTGNVTGVVGKVYRIREATALTTTAWTLDYTAPGVGGQDILSLTSFNGLLYASVAGDGASSLGAVFQRSTAGVYTSVDGYNNNASRAQSLIEFKGALYAWVTNYQGGTEKIRKTTDGTTWSTAYDTTDSTDMVMQFYNTGNKLFAIHRASTGIIGGYYSVNGTSWTLFNVATSDLAQHGFGWFK